MCARSARGAAAGALTSKANTHHPIQMQAEASFTLQCIAASGTRLGKGGVGRGNGRRACAGEVADAQHDRAVQRQSGRGGKRAPNCVKAPISQGSRNMAAPTVVTKPDTTLMPIVRSAYVTAARPAVGLCVMHVATCTT
jgi:hypothetical protein